MGWRGPRAGHRRRVPGRAVAAAARRPRAVRAKAAGCGAACAAQHGPIRALVAAAAAEAQLRPDELAEAVAEQLAARWGVVFRDIAARENLAIPWRDLLWAFRRMEARGTMRGGRFVVGFSGEQYAHPDAIDVLKSVRKQRTNRRDRPDLGRRSAEPDRHRAARPARPRHRR